MQILSYPLYQFIQVSELKQDILIKYLKRWLLFTLDCCINISLNKYHTLFSASFHKNNEEDRRIDEIELFNQLNFNHNLTETDINNIDVKSQLEYKFKFKKQWKMVGYLIKLIQ